MPLLEEKGIIEEEPLTETQIPEVRIKGDEAVIRVERPEGTTEERRVRLPKTTWA